MASTRFDVKLYNCDEFSVWHGLECSRTTDKSIIRRHQRQLIYQPWFPFSFSDAGFHMMVLAHLALHSNLRHFLQSHRFALPFDKSSTCLPDKSLKFWVKKFSEVPLSYRRFQSKFMGFGVLLVL